MNHNLLSMLENRYTVLETSQVDQSVERSTSQVDQLINPKNQYEIEVVSSQLDHLAEPKMNMDIT